MITVDFRVGPVLIVKRILVLSLILGIIIVICGVSQYYYEERVLEDWSERTIPPGGAASFDIPNLNRDDTLYVRFKSNETARVYVLCLSTGKTIIRISTRSILW